MSLIWWNGHLVDKADVRINPFEHGFLYGDGVWEPLRVFGGTLFRPAEHIQNLYRSAADQHIAVPLSPAELTAAIETTIHANDRSDGYIRVIVSRGPGTLGPDPRKILPQLLIIVEEYWPFPLELYPHGLHAASFTAPQQSGRLLGQPYLVRARRWGFENGCLEAILVTPEGRVTGSTEGMIFLVQEGALVVAGDHLPDVSGYAVATIAGESGLVVVECSVKVDDLLEAEEVLLAGTSCGVIGIVRVNGRTIGSDREGPITHQLRTRYLALTRGGE